MRSSDILQYLEKYQELWWCTCNVIGSCNNDVACDIIGDRPDESNYYGWDFTNDKRVLRLFFGGSSNFFCGIPIGNQDITSIDNIDQLLIYVFDLPSGLEGLEKLGNFKSYIQSELNEFINMYEEGDITIEFDPEDKPLVEMYLLAKEALRESEQFSDLLIVGEDYVPHLIDE